MDKDSQNKDGNSVWYPSTARFNSVSDWKGQSAEFQLAIESRIGELRNQLPAESESAVWELLAQTTGTEWQEARGELERAEKKLHRLHNDDQPLGPIGRALDGEHVERAEEKYNQALASFTLLDESLRQNGDVRDQLERAVAELRHRLYLIEEMEKTSQQLLKVNGFLDSVLKAGPEKIPEMPALPDIAQKPLGALSDESLLDHARQLARSALESLESLPSSLLKGNGGPSLSSLFGTFAKRSLASLRKPYALVTGKPFKPER